MKRLKINWRKISLMEKNGKEHEQAIQRNEFPKVRIYSTSQMVREM